MNAADSLAKTYFDRCDVYRYEDTIINGITKFNEVLKQSNVECALSKGSLAKPSGENIASVTAVPKVFFRPDADILEKDKLRITQHGSSFSKDYKAGEVFCYSGSHLEVQLLRNDAS